MRLNTQRVGSFLQKISLAADWWLKWVRLGIDALTDAARTCILQDASAEWMQNACPQIVKKIESL